MTEASSGMPSAEKFKMTKARIMGLSGDGRHESYIYVVEDGRAISIEKPPSPPLAPSKPPKVPRLPKPPNPDNHRPWLHFQRNQEPLQRNYPAQIVHKTIVIKPSFSQNTSDFHNDYPHTYPQNSAAHGAYNLYQQQYGQHPDLPNLVADQADNVHHPHYSQYPPYYGGNPGASGSGNQN